MCMVVCHFMYLRVCVCVCVCVCGRWKKMFPQRFLHPSVEICVHVYEGDDIRDGCMAPPMRWTWVWIDSGSWWWTRKPGTLQSMGSQRVGHDWETELNWYIFISIDFYLYIYKCVYSLHIHKYMPHFYIIYMKTYVYKYLPPSC